MVVIYYMFRTKRRPKFYVYLTKEERGEYPGIPTHLPKNFNGLPLKILAYVSNTWFGDIFVNPIVLKAIGVHRLRELKLECGPTFFPITSHHETRAKIDDSVDLTGVINAERAADKNTKDFRYHTAFDFVRAYKSGQLTPVDVAKRIIEFLDDRNEELRALCDWRKEYIFQQATDSANRYLNQKTLSPLDGTFTVVKDHISVKGMTARYGLSFNNKVEEVDTVVIERLKSSGIIIVGISHMTQLGMSVFGANPSPLHGTCRNPVNPNFYPGASSSGTAASICSGMVPFGIGTDGGGSIRMPSSMTGICGLKTTFGRVPANGQIPGKNSNSTVTVAGPMAGSIVDLALFYSVLAGPHADDPYSVLQTPVTLPATFSPYLDGIRIAVDWTWAKQADPAVFANFEAQIQHLEESGAEIVPFEMPEIPLINVGHIVTIATEGAEICREHICNKREMAPDNYVILNAALSAATADDYILAARLRTRVMDNLRNIFADVDAIATPTTGQTAEPICDGDEDGTWKFPATLRSMLYVKLANYSGIPAITIPSGYDENDLPTGIMIHGSWFSEELLIQIGYVVEQQFKRQQPQVYTDLLT